MDIKAKVGLSLGLSGLLVTLPVVAGNMGDVASVGMAHSGIVLGGDLGYGYLSSHESNNLNDALQNSVSPPLLERKFHNGSFTWAAHLGYDFLINQRFYLGVEAGFKSLGGSSGYANSVVYNNPTGSAYTATSYKFIDNQRAIDLLLIARGYVSNTCPGLNFFGKLGPAYVRAKDTAKVENSGTLPNNIMSKYDSSGPIIWRIEPEFDLGIGYTITKNIDAHVMYTYVHGTDGNTSTRSNIDGYTTPWQAVFAFNGWSAGLDYRF